MHDDPYYNPPPMISNQERRVAMWVGLITGAFAVVSQVISVGNARRNSKAWKAEVARRRKMYRMK